MTRTPSLTFPLSALPVVILLHPAVVVDDAELGHGGDVEGHQAQAHGGHHGLDKDRNCFI